ncbi:hypothetical protein [Streptomyces iranensis]|uniref:Uncharacterized protein n=1 Tax=Streptomyces iranensis TaxID=576784 RepID=A0A060ZMB5_9ACTN|nr:hypothetical protein [Streptomyces iranensis]MBP2062459.1 hypothetical protein [Streptomyces iranensis]CDR07332.1 predicted protein [Streptomyces iranensis]
MNTPRRPHLKSIPNTTDQPRPAEPGPAPDSRSAPRNVGRKAVPSALRSDPHQVTVTGIMPGLHVRMALRPPVADWLCRCGHHERARGRAAVIELTTRVRVGECPHRAPAPAETERRSAA